MSGTPARMPWFPAVPPALAAADGGGRIKQRRAGLPRLLHKLFVKVLRLRPASAAAEHAGFYGYRVGGGDDDEYCYYYSYGGAGSSWAGVLSSIPEEELDDGDSSDSEEEEGTPGVVVRAPAAVLRKAKSERFVVAAPDDGATVVHVEVIL